MPFRKFVVPFRGVIDRVLPNGRMIGAPGSMVEPVSILKIAEGNRATEHAPEGTSLSHSNYDPDTCTVIVEIECDDEVWLDKLEAYIKSIKDLRAAELAFMEQQEGSLDAENKSQSEKKRVEFAKGVLISRSDLNRWKRAKQ